MTSPDAQGILSRVHEIEPPFDSAKPLVKPIHARALPPEQGDDLSKRNFDGSRARLEISDIEAKLINAPADMTQVPPYEVILGHRIARTVAVGISF
jgi:hypothetical protein